MGWVKASVSGGTGDDPFKLDSDICFTAEEKHEISAVAGEYCE